MKNLKSLSVVLFALVTLALMQSCKKDKDEEINQTNQTFITMASSNNSFQLAATNMARSKGQSAEVTAFATTTGASQAELSTAVKTIAQSNNWIIPTNMEPKEQARLDMLTNLSGTAFDREFAIQMSQVSQEAVDLYTDGSGNGVSSAGLKTFASGKLAAMKTQLTAAQALRAKIN